MERINTDANNYVVFDVETNGLKSKTDDLLSITFFKPDDGKIYTRLLPLELARRVRTTKFNGIRTEDLAGKKPLTQTEFNRLIDEFELERRSILVYSGRKFDELFLREYLHRKHISGFDRLSFYNMKRQILSSRYSGGNVTKDNLCAMFDIKGVEKIHTGVNDCRLEWELFRKLDGYYYLITEGEYPDDNVFRMMPDYIIPVSYFASHPNLSRLYRDRPQITCRSKEIRKFEIDAEGLVQFGTNFDGMTIEHLIDVMLNAHKIDSTEFLLENKRKLQYVGGIPSAYNVVPMHFNANGTVTAIRKTDKEKEKEINRVLALFKKKLTPMIDYIRDEVFRRKPIMCQELVVNSEQNILAMCDLSTEDAVMEIKTNDVDPEQYAEQLFYESHGRKCYHLNMRWIKDWSTYCLKKVVFTISVVETEISESRPEVSESPHEKSSQNRFETRRDFITNRIKERIEPLSFQLVDYSGSTVPVRIKCMKCGIEQDIGYYRILHGSIRCNACMPIEDKLASNERHGEQGERCKLFADSFVAKVNNLSNGKLSLVSEYKGSRERISVMCKECGNKWDIRADHLIARCYCPDCKFNRRWNND